MAKRLTLLDTIVRNIDEKIASLQQARQHILEEQAQADREKRQRMAKASAVRPHSSGKRSSAQADTTT